MTNVAIKNTAEQNTATETKVSVDAKGNISVSMANPHSKAVDFSQRRTKKDTTPSRVVYHSEVVQDLGNGLLLSVSLMTVKSKYEKAQQSKTVDTTALNLDRLSADEAKALQALLKKMQG